MGRKRLRRRQPCAKQDRADQPGFDFTAHARRLCEHMVSRLPELAHINLARVAVSFSQARANTSHGLLAAVTPMRFEGGRETTVKNGRRYATQKLLDATGREMLYILTFYLPRFLDLPYREKLITIFHELWHISPAFDGDIRRHPGRYHVHSHSEREYDAAMEGFVDRWLSRCPPPEVTAFLHNNFDGLRRRHGAVRGTKIPHPKLLPMHEDVR